MQKNNNTNKICSKCNRNNLTISQTDYESYKDFEKLGYKILGAYNGKHKKCTLLDKEGYLYIKNPKSNITVGSLQIFLDEYLKEYGGKIDYIHGDDVTKNLSKEDGNIGFILEPMQKNELFKTVMLEGALPRKTFSMGHSNDKRYYLECRKIK